MRHWDAAFEADCHRLVVALCERGAAAPARDAAWRALVTAIAPHVEDWVRRSPVLQRCRLVSEDEPRQVLVGVLVRLSRREFDNLRGYLERRAAVDEDEEGELRVVEELVQLCGEGTAPGERAEPGEATPLRGWLRNLVRYAIKDHVKQRLGWGSSAQAVWRLGGVEAGQVTRALADEAGVVDLEVSAEPGGLRLRVDYLPGTLRPEEMERRLRGLGAAILESPRGPRSRRELGSEAGRLDDVPESGERPPLTDLVGLRRVLDQVNAHLATFPPAMQQAVRLWMTDHDFDEIAGRLGLPGGDDARALVRAAQARLRERFRR